MCIFSVDFYFILNFSFCEIHTHKMIFFLSVGVPVLYLYKNSVPYRRGFFCNDDSLRYPYKENTISDDLLLLIGFALPFVVVSSDNIHFQNVYYVPQTKQEVAYFWTFVSQISLTYYNSISALHILSY